MFEKKEVSQLILAVLLITYLIMFSDFTLVNFFVSLVFAFLLLIPHVIAHKIVAEHYLAEAKFKFLGWKRFWLFEDSEFKNPVPFSFSQYQQYLYSSKLLEINLLVNGCEAKRTIGELSFLMREY